MAAVAFSTIARGFNSGIPDAEQVVIQTAQEWEAFCGRHGSDQRPPPAVPDVDFASEMVICVHIGTKNTGGFAVEIKTIEDAGGDLVVRYETMSPPPGAMCCMALTQPHHIVRLARSDKSVIFEGSEAAPPARPTTFCLTFEKSLTPEDKVAILSTISTLDGVTKTNMLKSCGIGIVDVSGDCEAAKKALAAVEGVLTVEQD